MKVDGHKGWRVGGQEKHMREENWVWTERSESFCPSIILTEVAYICGWKWGRLQDKGGVSPLLCCWPLYSVIIATWGFDYSPPNIQQRNSVHDVLKFLQRSCTSDTSIWALNWTLTSFRSNNHITAKEISWEVNLFSCRQNYIYTKKVRKNFCILNPEFINNKHLTDINSR